MKRLAMALLLAVVVLSMASCNGSGKKSSQPAQQEQPAQPEQQAQPQQPEQQVAQEQHSQSPSEVRVYANAYDGFVNIRKSPTTKSPTLGRFKNGNDYVVVLGIQDNWYAVSWHGVVGYVHKNMVGYTPWKPVFLDVTAEDIAGWYNLGYSSLLIFANGKYANIHQYGDMEYGLWKFEGTEIVLTTKHVTEYGKSFDCRVGNEVRYGVDNHKKAVVVGQKQVLHPKSYYDQFDEEYFGGEMVFSKESFRESLKTVNKYVKWQ